MLRKLIIFIFVSFFIFKIFGESFKEESEEIILTVGEATTLNVPYPQRVSINNPNVVDIPEVLENEIVIVAKGVGETAINIWTKEGKKTFYVVVYSHDLDRTKAKLEKLIREELNIKNVKVKKNETLGKVMLLGEVEVSEKELIDKALEMFFEKETRERKMPLEDKVENLLKVKKESKMVEIEARILEINKTKLDQLGVKWMEKLQIRQEPYKAEATTELG
ncbi:MAG: pilus assembly protein N-terminal domain-containing protein, partial [Candidatus Aenigmatarchaeota archaeon]